MNIEFGPLNRTKLLVCAIAAASVVSIALVYRKKGSSHAVEFVESAIPQQEKPASPIKKALELKGEGNVLFNNGDVHGAITLYKECAQLLENQPVHDLAIVHSNLAACYLKIQAFPDAISASTEALKIDPHLSKALERRSRAFQAMGNEEAAAADVMALCLLSEFCDNTLIKKLEDLLARLSEARLCSGDYPVSHCLPARFLIDDFLHSFGGMLEIEKHAFDKDQSLYADIREHIKCSDYAKASELLDSASSLTNPSASQKALILELQGTFLFLRGLLREARAAFDACLGVCACPSALIKSALLYFEMDNSKKMVESFELALELDPENCALFFHRGEILALGGNFVSAVQDFEQSISLNPAFSLAYVHKARAMLSSGDILGAISFIEGSILGMPDDRDLLNCLAELYTLNKNYEASEQLFLRLLGEEKDAINPQVFLNAALMYLSWKNDLGKAKHYFQRAIQVEPLFDSAHLQLASIYVQEGLRSDAMSCFDTLIKNCRSPSEQLSFMSARIAAELQLVVTERYPDLASKFKQSHLL